jgi:hypothetical protein
MSSQSTSVSSSTVASSSSQTTSSTSLTVSSSSSQTASYQLLEHSIIDDIQYAYSRISLFSPT